MKPFLILQLRPETEASDNEYEAILQKAGLRCDETRRIRLDCSPDVPEISKNKFSGVIVGHKEALQELPRDCIQLVTSPTCPFQMIRYKSNVYATQFHPEADSQGFEVRIRIYKNKGYFPPDDATRLITMCRNSNVHAPERILRNFVDRYLQPKP